MNFSGEIMRNLYYLARLCLIFSMSIIGLSTHAFGQDRLVTFAVDPYWPKPLPNKWILGQVSGIATDARDHIWIIQRPSSLSDDERGAAFKPPISTCCVPAPPVMEFDNKGNFIQAWGGPHKGYDWPSLEHGIYIDQHGFVWITGIGENDGQILKFTRNGKFVLQIGKPGKQTGSNDVTRLGRAANVEVDPTADEIYVADGYYNHRVIVFNATTGTYKRHWGAYGKSPLDNEKVTLSRLTPPPVIPSSQFGNPVHCARISHDNLVYVCDRFNNRIQIFRKNGTFIKEFFVEPKTAGNGSVWDIAFSKDHEQRYI